MSTYWNDYYKKLPLEKIPWQRTQADWFKHAVDQKVISGKTALDLGCGTGKKSIYLAQNGFEKVIGVDISAQAIKYARQNAKEAGVENKTTFYVYDITDLNFLKNETFGFILDWAALHCIEPKKVKQYIQEIVKHSHEGSLLMLRVFSSREKNKQYFIDSALGSDNKVYVYSKEQIEKLYGNDFEIIKFNRSRPRHHADVHFIEFLMRRK